MKKRIQLSNKKIESIAIDTVIIYERKKHRQAKDVRKKRLGYDIKSTNRVIEVKGIEKQLSDSGNWRFIQQRSVQLLLRKTNFYVYIVDNVARKAGKRGIYILNRTQALPFLKIDPRVSYTIQIPANERDRFRTK